MALAVTCQGTTYPWKEVYPWSWERARIQLSRRWVIALTKANEAITRELLKLSFYFVLSTRFSKDNYHVAHLSKLIILFFSANDRTSCNSHENV